MTSRKQRHDPPCPGPDAHVTHWGRPSCTGHSKRRGGLPCEHTPMQGQTVCANHGGKSPQAKAAAQQRLELAAATTAVTTLGLRRDINPIDALLEEVHWTAGHVQWLRDKIGTLPEGDLEWGMTKSKTGGDDRGDTYEAKPSIWYELYTRERRHLIECTKAAIAAGIAERQVRLAEAQGAQVAAAIRGILADLQLTEAQQELVATVVPARLRLLAGGAA